MKKIDFFGRLIIPLFLFFYGATTDAQNITITTDDATWQASQNCAGPWGPSFNIGPCVSNCVNQCFCQPWNNNWNLNIDPAICQQAEPIWGIPPPADCNYPSAGYFFRITFDLGCSQVNAATMIWQADNNSRVWINPQDNMGNSIPVCGLMPNFTQNGYNTSATANIAGNLQPGQNEIVVHVFNDPWQCPNWAFLIMCIQINVTPITLDASFTLNSTGVPGGSILSSGNVQNTNLYHEWYFMTGPTQNGPWTPVGVIQGSVNFCCYFAEQCVYHRIIHRVALRPGSDCEACFERIFYDCGERGRQELATGRIDCSELDNYEWDVIGLKTPGGDEARPGLPQGVDLGESRVAELSVHPNPTNNLLNLTWTGEQMEQMKVLDINGKIVLEREVENDAFNLQLDVSMLPAGVYLIELSNGSQKLTKKFSVSK